MSTPYSKMKVAELKAELIGRGRIPPLSLQGSKAILVARLIRDDNAAAGDIASASGDHKVTSVEQLEAAGSGHAIYEWAMQILSSDVDSLGGVTGPQPAALGAAVDHPDVPVVQTLLVEISTAMGEMTPPEPPSMMVALEMMKGLVRLEMVDILVCSTLTQKFLEIFDIESDIWDGQVGEDAQNDFSTQLLLPTKQALGRWLSDTIRDFETRGVATKFPEYFNTKDVATLRAWAKTYIRTNDLDTSTNFTSATFEAALADESLTMERAKSLVLVTTILNQAAAAMNRDQRARKGKGKKRAAESDSSSNSDESGDDAGEAGGRRRETLSARSREKKKQRVIESDEE